MREYNDGTFSEIEDAETALKNFAEEIKEVSVPEVVALHVGSWKELEDKIGKKELEARVKDLEDEARTNKILARSNLVRPTTAQIRTINRR